MVVVAAFFLGQRSDEIVSRIVSVVGTTKANSATAIKLAKYGDGSVILTAKHPIPRLTNFDPSVANVVVLDAQRVRIVPNLNGNTVLKVSHENGEATQLKITVAEGDVASISESQHP
jgi:hypothetical protein